jgi:hypothetical protein
MRHGGLASLLSTTNISAFLPKSCRTASPAGVETPLTHWLGGESRRTNVSRRLLGALRPGSHNWVKRFDSVLQLALFDQSDGRGNRRCCTCSQPVWVIKRRCRVLDSIRCGVVTLSAISPISAIEQQAKWLKSHASAFAVIGQFRSN